jgi:Ca2+-binding RTX toxin-like protein
MGGVSMVKFVAARAVHMQDLSELAELDDWGNVQAPNSKVTSSFTATLKSNTKIKYDFEGNNLTLVGEQPIGGNLKSIAVLFQNDMDYQISSLSISFIRNTIQKTFGDGFESRLFSGNDSIVGSDQADVLIGYGGNDTVKGRGGDDKIVGKKGSDKLSGNAGDDNISGKKGKDVFDGGSGNDTLTGGGGRDKFIFDSSLNAATNVDTVTDLSVGTDLIKLDSSVFLGIGRNGPLAASKFVVASSAQDGDDLIVYDKTTGALYYDGDGSGGNAQTQFAKLDAGLNLSASDFVVFS